PRQEQKQLQKRRSFEDINNRDVMDKILNDVIKYENDEKRVIVKGWTINIRSIYNKILQSRMRFGGAVGETLKISDLLTRDNEDMINEMIENKIIMTFREFLVYTRNEFKTKLVNFLNIFRDKNILNPLPSSTDVDASYFHSELINMRRSNYIITN